MKSKRRIQAYYVKKFITIDWKKRAVVLDAADNALWDIRTNIFLGEVDDVNSQKKSLSAQIIDINTLHIKYSVKRTIMQIYYHSTLENI